MGAIELVSPLTPDECAARLREVTGDDGLLTWFGTFSSRPVVGRVSGRSVRIRKQIVYGNSFQTILTGQLKAHSGGTVFRGRTGMRVFVIVFMVFWFCGVVMIGGLISITAFCRMVGIDFGGQRRADGLLSWQLVPLLLPALMLAIGAYMVRFARRIARDERRFLIDFVAETIGSPSASDVLR